MKNTMRIVLAVAVCALMVFGTHSQPTSAQTPPPICQSGTATYNAAACAASYPACAVGTATYNAITCAAAGTGTTAGSYCTVGSATYNAALNASLTCGNVFVGTAP